MAAARNAVHAAVLAEGRLLLHQLEKKDYNFTEPAGTWNIGDDWRNRKDPQKPFYSVINIPCTHESQCRESPHDKILFDPAKVPIPPFHPDTPEVRGNWAKYHENIRKWTNKLEIFFSVLKKTVWPKTRLCFSSVTTALVCPGVRNGYGNGDFVFLSSALPQKGRPLGAGKTWREDGSPCQLCGLFAHGTVIVWR